MSLLIEPSHMDETRRRPSKEKKRAYARERQREILALARLAKQMLAERAAGGGA